MFSTIGSGTASQATPQGRHHKRAEVGFELAIKRLSGMDTGRRCAMARCRVGAGAGDGHSTTGGVGGVRAPEGSSRERGLQNSSSGTTANATRHRKSMQYYEMHNTYNAYKMYDSNNVKNVMSEFSRISRIIFKIMSIIVRL